MIYSSRKEINISQKEESNMKKNKPLLLVGLGIACLAFLLGSVWYSLTFNGGRLVTPTDFSAYVFQMNDLPMLLSVLCFALYVLFLGFLLLRAVFRAKRGGGAPSNHTRKLSPMLGLLGFLGFLGFAGIWTYQVDGSIFPVCFFLFFGFFGFFFEGKMSDTLMDERFRENADRAQLKAYKTGFILLFLLLLVVGGRVLGNLELTAIIFQAGTALILGVTLFLSEYLLYRYDCADRRVPEEGE